MNRDLEKILAEDFPHFFAALRRRKLYELDDLLNADKRGMELIELFGIETDNGWYPLIRRLAEKLEPWCRASGAYCVQLKEKFGTLRCYMDQAADSIPRLRLETRSHLTIAPTPSDNDARLAIEEAEAESSRTCECCGDAGLPRNHGGWYSVRCDACDNPAKRFIERTENVERLLKYVIKPQTAEDAKRWRQILYESSQT